MFYRPLLTLTIASTVLICVMCVVLSLVATGSLTRLENLADRLTILTGVENAGPSGSGEPTPETDARSKAWSVQHREALQESLREARAEWWLTMALAVLLASGSLVLAWLLRRNVLIPLDTLNRLLGTMSLRRHEEVDVTDIRPALRPLFESYNDLVSRVHGAREVQAEREAELRHELREATRTLMQQQMAALRDQRLATNGELTAQIAHDMRNPLAGILAAVQNLRRDTEHEEHAERLELVQEEVRRLSRQLDGLVDASRQPPEPATPVNLCNMVESVLTLASYQLSPQIVLGCDIDPGLVLEVPEGGLRQALLNLVINASNAIGDHSSGTIDVDIAHEDEHVVLRVTDSGPGFSRESLAAGGRAFATFTADGTGLGLAAVRRFIVDLGGRMELSNAERGGARVALLFPKRLRHE